MRKITLAAALVAAFALTAAPAFAYEYSGKASTGEAAGTQVFVTGGSTVECEKASFAVESVTASTVVATPLYSSCTYGGKAATVENAGEGSGHSAATAHCSYEFPAPTSLSGERYSGSVNVVNNHSGTCEFKITGTLLGFSCTVDVKAQNGLASVFAENAETELLVSSKVEKIAYTSSGSGCGLGGVPAEGTNGSYSGEVLVKELKVS